MLIVKLYLLDISYANFAKVVIREPTLVENGRETIDLPGLPGSDLTLALVFPLLILSLVTQVCEI